MTEEEYKELLEQLNKEGEESIIKKLMLTNAELLEALYDQQEFMEENNLSSNEFYKWKQKKDMRILN